MFLKKSMIKEVTLQFQVHSLKINMKPHIGDSWKSPKSKCKYTPIFHFIIARVILRCNGLQSKRGTVDR